MIELRNITKSFEGRLVLDRFSLSVSAGTGVAFQGESGRGKTTLLRIVAGLEKPDSGEVSGVDRTSLSYMFQEPRLFYHMNALLNVAVVLPDYPKKNALEKAALWLERVGLYSDREKMPGELSGGMRQRVALARTLCAGGEVFLFDEPFSALDRQTAEKMRDLVRRETANKTFFLVTHSREDAERLCNKIILL